jgi:hypothetical protein
MVDRGRGRWLAVEPILNGDELKPDLQSYRLTIFRALANNPWLLVKGERRCS